MRCAPGRRKLGRRRRTPCARRPAGATTASQLRRPLRRRPRRLRRLLEPRVRPATRRPSSASARELAPHMRTALGRRRREHAHTLPSRPASTAPRHSPPYWTALARAKYLVNNVNFARRRGQAARPGPSSRPSTAPRSSTWAWTCSDYPAAAAGMTSASCSTASTSWDYSPLRQPRTPPRSGSGSTPAPTRPLEYGYPRNDVF